MFTAVTTSILRLGNFSDEELSLFYSKLKVNNYQKGSVLLKGGIVCRSLYFLNTGSCRQFYTDATGNEVTVNLYVEHDWLADYESFTAQKPAKHTTEVFEDCEIIEIEVNALHELIRMTPSFFRLGKLLAQLQRPDYIHKAKSPDKKYKELLVHKPLLVQKFPLKYLASYLQITQETLSRVRRRVTP